MADVEGTGRAYSTADGRWQTADRLLNHILIVRPGQSDSLRARELGGKRGITEAWSQEEGLRTRFNNMTLPYQVFLKAPPACLPSVFERIPVAVSSLDSLGTGCIKKKQN